MAIVWTESFAWSNVQADYLNKKGDATSHYANCDCATTITAGAWTGSKAGTVTSGATGFIFNLPTARGSCIIGFRYQGSAGQARNWNISMHTGAGGGGFVVLSAQNAAGAIRLSEHTIGQDGSVPYSEDGSWHYIEVEFVIGGTSTVRQDGVTVLTATNSQTGTMASVEVSSAGVSGGYLLSDVYIIDPNVGSNTTFLGDVHIELDLPTGAGASTQWTALSGSNYANVADSPAPDGDTTYVHTNTLGNRDYYGVGNIREASPSAVYAMAVYLVAKTATPGAGGVRASISSAGSELDASANTTPPTGSYGKGGFVIADTDPHTGAAWTATAVNAAQPGMVLHS